MNYEDGYLELKYIQTVSVNGVTCKKLVGQAYGTMGWQGSQPLTMGSPTIITYESNGVISYQTGPQRFDTIANFNANIGDGWYVPDWDSTNFICSRKKVVVNTTSTVMINGQSLKKLTTSDGDIIEKIGPLNGFIHGYYYCCLDCWAYLGDFRCYRDSGFAVYSKPGTSDCNFVSVKENSSDLKKIRLFPNPNKGQFTLTTDDPVQVLIFDQLGSLVYETKIENAGEYTFDLRDMTPGLYILKAENKLGSANFKLLRE
jgi:hypothetical protein